MNAKEASFYTAILIVCAVVGVIIFYFIVSIIRQQRRAVRLYKQSLLTEITTLEKERSRMASDLHDEVGPMLSAIKLRIASFDVNEEDEEKALRLDGSDMGGRILQIQSYPFHENQLENFFDPIQFTTSPPVDPFGSPWTRIETEPVSRTRT